MKNITLPAIIITLCISCSRITPVNHWSGFDPDNLKVRNSDQGPWGGTSEMYWKHTSKNHFKPGDVIKHARKIGWVLADRIAVPKSTLQTWTKYNSEPGFALTFTNSFTNAVDFPFTRWTNENVMVYRFKTKTIAIVPDNAGETNKNGYAVLSLDGKELSVYHLWGE